MYVVYVLCCAYVETALHVITGGRNTRDQQEGDSGTRVGGGEAGLIGMGMETL